MGPVRIAVLIPALDEARALPGVLTGLPEDVRVVVADNGSTDGTADVARVHGAEVVVEPRRGYGSAVQAALAVLADAPPQVVVILDADGADPVECLHALTDPILRDEADMVLADRSRTAEPGALNATQRFGNAFAVWLMHRASGHRYRDMGPFRAIRYERLVAMDLRDPTWGWNVEMQLKAVHHGLRILEIPLPYRNRAAGRSKISGSLSGAIRAGGRILWAVNHYR